MLKKEVGKELIPTADLQKLQTIDAFDGDGIYPNLTAGKALQFRGCSSLLT